MKKQNSNDFIINIFQDFNEVESMLKVLKDSVCNENKEIENVDIVNTLDVIVNKMINTKISMNKYINEIF